jgi:hypothetical protein
MTLGASDEFLCPITTALVVGVIGLACSIGRAWKTGRRQQAAWAERQRSDMELMELWAGWRERQRAEAEEWMRMRARARTVAVLPEPTLSCHRKGCASRLTPRPPDARHCPRCGGRLA